MTFSVPALGTKAVTQVKKGTRNKPAIKLLCYLCICDSIFLTGCPSSNCALTDHTGNVICDHTQYIRNKIELTILINGSFRNLVADTECKLFIELLTGNGFPVTAYINSFRYLPEQDHLQEQSVVFYL